MPPPMSRSVAGRARFTTVPSRKTTIDTMMASTMTRVVCAASRNFMGLVSTGVNSRAGYRSSRANRPHGSGGGLALRQRLQGKHLLSHHHQVSQREQTSEKPWAAEQDAHMKPGAGPLGTDRVRDRDALG